MTDTVRNVLFLCTGNTARSVLAESILRKEGEGRFRSFSAGSQPKGIVHSQAIATLTRHGYPTNGMRSKSWDEFGNADAPQMDFIFTVCSNAAGETCPIWPGHPASAHWGIDDPAAASPEDQPRAFEDAFQAMRDRIRRFLRLNLDGVSADEAKRLLAAIGSTPSIRPAVVADAEVIAAIYAHHVLHGTASFDTVPRSVEATIARIEECVGRGWPFLVAESATGVLGYAYATQFRDRPAYAHACENSIYVRHDLRGSGIGAALLARLISAAEAFGFRQMIAVAGGGEPASVGLHEQLGFTLAGRMRSVGRKKGKWLDTVYLQIALGAGDTTPPEHET